MSDLPGAVEGLGPEHGLSLSMQQHWEQCRLSSATVSPDIVADTLLLWRDAMSPYSLVHFKDLADLGAPQVGLLSCAQSACPVRVGTFADDLAAFSGLEHACWVQVACFILSAHALHCHVTVCHLPLDSKSLAMCVDVLGYDT